jgi:hypothetical protein
MESAEIARQEILETTGVRDVCLVFLQTPSKPLRELVKLHKKDEEVSLPLIYTRDGVPCRASCPQRRTRVP